MEARSFWHLSKYSILRLSALIHTVNDLINTNINATYLISAPLKYKVCIRRPPLVNTPCLLDSPLLRIVLAIKEAKDANMAKDGNMVTPDDDEDIDIKLWTTYQQIGLDFYSQTLFSILLYYSSYLFCWH